MKLAELMEKVKAIEYDESTFSRIMHAETVQELMSIPVSSDELLSYIEAAEEFGKLIEDGVLYAQMVTNKLEDACPAKSRRHALFM